MAHFIDITSELKSLWQDLEPNKRNRALVIARLLLRHGTDEQKATYAEKVKNETYPCDEREDALRILTPTTAVSWLSQITQTATVQPLSKPIRMDVESGRLAIALNKAAEFRIWSIGRELVREENGTGKLTRNAFYEALAGFGADITRDHFSRLLRQGRDLFWRIDRNMHTIYINSPRQVAPLLVEAALKKCPALVATNLPGGRDMYISVSDSHEAFEAALYAGWMSHREDPTISREVLTTLFNRAEDTLRRWENTRLANTVTVRENYAQYEPDPNTWDSFIPDHARPYLANARREGGFTQVIRYRWRIPNTYITSPIRQHPKRGQNRKVSNIVRRLLDQSAGGFSVPEQSGQPTIFFGREIKKLYFHDAKKLKRYVRKTGVGVRMLWRGQDKYGRGVFEPTESYGHTYPNERARFKEEYHFFKKQRLKMQAFIEGQTMVS
jgi:hypothetical protein